MIYVKLNGRIGNYLFQIATAATLAKNNNTRFAVVCHEKYLLQEPDNCTIYQYIQQFRTNIFKDIVILTTVPDKLHNYIQQGALFQSIPFIDNIYLHGTFQSEKYFDREITKELFQIPFDIKESLIQRFGHILEKGPTSINIRRGDYLKRPHEYNVASLSFFKKAINRIGKNNGYLIISDDINWCKKHFKESNYFFADNNTPTEDLYLQTLCKNNIISNSTFSWWGAWLNSNPEKIVIVPKPWYGKSLSYIRTDDLIPQEWIQIENRMPLFLRIRAYKNITKDFLRPIYYNLKSKLRQYI